MGDIRISVGNLASFIVSGGGSYHRFGIPNMKKLEAGERSYQALGGAARLTPFGVAHLMCEFGASRFELDAKTGLYDARFLVDEAHVENVFKFFNDIAGEMNHIAEDNPIGDILEELTGEEAPSYLSPIVPKERVGEVMLVYHDSVRQKASADGIGTSARAAVNAVPTRRIFRRYTLILPGDLYFAAVARGTIRLLRASEVATTEGGSRKGITRDGAGIADNIFS